MRGGYLLNRKKSDAEGPAERDHKHRVRVQISRDAMADTKATLLDNARMRRTEWFAEVFWNLPYEPYAPIRKQLLGLLRQVNAARSAVGLSKIQADVICYQQRKVKVF